MTHLDYLELQLNPRIEKVCFTTCHCCHHLYQIFVTVSTSLTIFLLGLPVSSSLSWDSHWLRSIPRAFCLPSQNMITVTVWLNLSLILNVMTGLIPCSRISEKYTNCTHWNISSWEALGAASLASRASTRPDLASKCVRRNPPPRPIDWTLYTPDHFEWYRVFFTLCLPGRPRVKNNLYIYHWFLTLMHVMSNRLGSWWHLIFSQYTHPSC